MKHTLAMLAVLMIATTAAHGTEAAPAPAPRPATVLLVTSQQLAPAWQEWVTLKTRLGWATKLVTVDEIRRDYAGDDIQAKIRECVLDHIEQHGTRYVVLGGDSQPDGKGHVPHHVVYHRLLETQGQRFPGNVLPPGDANLPVDLYYISPRDKDWDADEDGRFGEWADDREAIAYTHPAGVSFGRIPVRTTADVKAYTQKVYNYEFHFPKTEFATRFMYTNTTHGSEPKVRRSWDDYLSEAWEGGQAYRFFHTSTPWDDQADADYALNTRHFLDRINGQTASKLHIHGHGMPQFWVLEHASGKTAVNAQAIEHMTNRRAPLVLTTVSCFTGQFDTEGDPSIVESILRARDKGAVLAIAPSRSGVPVFHDPKRDFPLMVREGKLDGTTQTMTRFWVNGLSPREDGTYRTAGQAFMRAKAQMTDDAVKTENYHALQFELNLLGDPTLYLRPVDPIEATLTFDAEFDPGVTRYTATTVPGATVCVWMGDHVYAVATADDEGKAAFELDIPKADTVEVTVSGPHINAKTWTMPVGQRAKSPATTPTDAAPGA